MLFLLVNNFIWHIFIPEKAHFLLTFPIFLNSTTNCVLFSSQTIALTFFFMLKCHDAVPNDKDVISGQCTKHGSDLFPYKLWNYSWYMHVASQLCTKNTVTWIKIWAIRVQNVRRIQYKPFRWKLLQTSTKFLEMWTWCILPFSPATASAMKRQHCTNSLYFPYVSL